MLLFRFKLRFGAVPMRLRKAFWTPFTLPDQLAAQTYGFFGRFDRNRIERFNLRIVNHGILLPML